MGGFIIYFLGCTSCGQYNVYKDLYRGVFNSTYDLVGTIDNILNPGSTHIKLVDIFHIPST